MYIHTAAYIHMYIHMYVATYIHTYVYMYIHMYIHMYVATYIHMYIHTYIHMYIHMYVARRLLHMNICTYIQTYILTYKRTHIQTDTQTHIHTYIHTYKHIDTRTRIYLFAWASFRIILSSPKLIFWREILSNKNPLSSEELFSSGRCVCVFVTLRALLLFREERVLLRRVVPGKWRERWGC